MSELDGWDVARCDAILCDMKAANEFRCEACGQRFVSTWTEEAARAEADATFTPEELADTGVVCDDCWRSMREAMPDFDARYAEG